MAYKTKFTGRYLSDCYDYQTAIEAVIEAQYKRAQSDYRSFKAQERAVPAPYQVTLDCLKALKDAFANNKHQPLALHWHVEQFIYRNKRNLISSFFYGVNEQQQCASKLRKIQKQYSESYLAGCSDFINKHYYQDNGVDLEMAATENQELREEIKALKHQLLESEAESERLQKAKNELIQETRQLKQQNSRKSEQINALNKRIHEQKHNEKMLRKQIQNLALENKSLHRKVQEGECRIIDLSDELNRTQVQVESLKGHVEETYKKCETYKVQCETYKKETQIAQRETAEMKNVFQNVLERLDKLENQPSSASEAISVTKNHYSSRPTPSPSSFKCFSLQTIASNLDEDQDEETPSNPVIDNYFGIN